MDGVKLTDFRENTTIIKQMGRGHKEKNRFDTDSFMEDNRISLDLTYMFDPPGKDPITKKDIDTLIPRVLKAQKMLERNEGDIHDSNIAMTGWQTLPEERDKKHLDEIKSVTSTLSRGINAFVSLGIGGSYLGIEATFRALTHTYFNQLTREKRGGAPEIYFLGQNMDPDYFRDTLDMLEGKRVGLNVISKSGTTTETAIAFRILQQIIEKSWGKQARRFIIVTTDKSKGAL